MSKLAIEENVRLEGLRDTGGLEMTIEWTATDGSRISVTCDNGSEQTIRIHTGAGTAIISYEDYQRFVCKVNRFHAHVNGILAGTKSLETIT
jgi:hypothetical protein